MSTIKRDDGRPVVPLPARKGRPTQREPRMVPAYELPVPPYPNGRVPWVIATPLSQCRTTKEILEVAYDGISAHMELCEKCVLHRNINWWNILRVTWSRFETLDRAEVARKPNIRAILSGDATATPCALLIDIDQAAVRHNHPIAALILPRAGEGDNEGPDAMADLMSGALSGMMAGIAVGVASKTEGEDGSNGYAQATGPSAASEPDSRPGSPIKEVS